MIRNFGAYQVDCLDLLHRLRLIESYEFSKIKETDFVIILKQRGADPQNSSVCRKLITSWLLSWVKALSASLIWPLCFSSIHLLVLFILFDPMTPSRLLFSHTVLYSPGV